jgi:hypothetical protein
MVPEGTEPPSEPQSLPLAGLRPIEREFLGDACSLHGEDGAVVADAANAATESSSSSSDSDSDADGSSEDEELNKCSEDESDGVGIEHF